MDTGGHTQLLSENRRLMYALNMVFIHSKPMCVVTQCLSARQPLTSALCSRRSFYTLLTKILIACTWADGKCLQDNSPTNQLAVSQVAEWITCRLV